MQLWYTGGKRGKKKGKGKGKKRGNNSPRAFNEDSKAASANGDGEARNVLQMKPVTANGAHYLPEELLVPVERLY